MNKEDVGSYFLNNKELYYCCGYIDKPALILKNTRTGQKEIVVINSIAKEYYSKLFYVPCADVYNLDLAEPVKNINLEKEVS